MIRPLPSRRPPFQALRLATRLIVVGVVSISAVAPLDGAIVRGRQDTAPAFAQGNGAGRVTGKAENPGRGKGPPSSPAPSPAPAATAPPTPAATPQPVATTAPLAAASATPQPAANVSPAPAEIGAAAVSSPVVDVYPGENLQARIDAAPSGTVFSLHRGTYPKLRLRAGITVQSAGDGEVVVTGGTGSWDAGIKIKDASGVTVRGLTIRGNTLGIFMRNARGAIIENNIITDNAYGLEIQGTTTGTVVRLNGIENNDRVLDAGRKAGGINLYETTGGILISTNTILNNDSVGVEIYGADDAVIDSNVIAGSADAIETGTDAGGDCKNNRVSRNVIYNAHHRLEERGIWLRCMSASTVAHNTVYGMDKFGIGVNPSGQFAGPITSLRIVNNIISNGRGFWLGSGLPTSVVIDYNDAFPCEVSDCPAFGNLIATLGAANYSSLAALQSATPYMDHGFSSDPLLLNPLARNFGVAADSPVIDRGQDLGWGHLGGAPDVGQDEER